MARNGTYSKTIEAYFRENPNKVVSVAKLGTLAKCRPTAVSAAISYLNRKAREGKGGLRIETIQRGKTWGYYPDVATNKAPEFRERVTVPVPDWTEVTANKLDLAQMQAPDWAEAEQAFSQAKEITQGWYHEVGKAHDGSPLVKNNVGMVFKVVPV